MAYIAPYFNESLDYVALNFDSVSYGSHVLVVFFCMEHLYKGLGTV